MVAITDIESAEEWARSVSQEARVAFAARCALRALPGVGMAVPWWDDRRILHVLRALLLSGLAANGRQHELRKPWDDVSMTAMSDSGYGPTSANAAYMAASAADSALYVAINHESLSLDTAVLNASKAAESCAGAVFWAIASDDQSEPDPTGIAARSSAYAVAGSDMARLASNDQEGLFGRPLWHGGEMPEGLRVGYGRMEAFWRSKGDSWGFWERWYEGMLEGRPMPWELQEAVALIPDDIWDEGPGRVADEIRKLEFGHITTALPRLVRDEDADLFRVEDAPVPPPEVADFVCRRVVLALDAALHSVSPNVFNDRSYEAIVIRDTLASEPKSVSVLAVGFYDACLGFNRNIGDVYPDDVALTNLKNALWGATEELCELDEKARERCARLAGFNPEKSVEDLPREDLLAIPEAVHDQVDDSARTIIESDVERALSKENPPTRTIRIRLTNWLTEISIWMDRAMKGDKRAQWLAGVVDRLRQWWENTSD